MNNDNEMMTDDIASAQLEEQDLIPREYQLEMLNESLKRNIIIALDTGSGKTHIAVLRLKLEAERESHKACLALSLSTLPLAYSRDRPA
jgi:endoribonuclease Dicer